MGMSTHVIGFVPPDETWNRMKAIWDACNAAEIDVPEKVANFFGGEAPDDEGVEVEMPVVPWGDDSRDGYELDVKLIPPHVTTIRFFNSW